jgi:putative phage-type endonuclease
MVIDMSPGSDEWRRRITASKVAAILGLSPWESPRSVWHAMHGDLPRSEANEAQNRGHFLEPAILAWWCSQHDDFVSGGEQPVFELGDWAAATPDMYGLLSGDVGVLVEAKSAAYDDEWGRPGTDEIPAYYLAQVIWQMHISGIHTCHVPMIGPRLKFAEYVIHYEPYAEDAKVIEARMREFYDTLAADTPPPLDDSVATWEAVRRIHPEIDRGTEVELTYDEAIAFADAIHDEENAIAHARLMRATVLERMGRAQFAKHAGIKVARRQPRGDAITFVPLAKHPNDIPEKEPAA